MGVELNFLDQDLSLHQEVLLPPHLKNNKRSEMYSPEFRKKY